MSVLSISDRQAQAMCDLYCMVPQTALARLFNVDSMEELVFIQNGGMGGNSRTTLPAMIFCLSGWPPVRKQTG